MDTVEEAGVIAMDICMDDAVERSGRRRSDVGGGLVVERQPLEAYLFHRMDGGRSPDAPDGTPRCPCSSPTISGALMVERKGVNSASVNAQQPLPHRHRWVLPGDEGLPARLLAGRLWLEQL